MPKKGSTAVKVTFMTMTLVTLVTAVKFDYGTVQSRFATPCPLLEMCRCFPYLYISEILIQFIWERPEIEVLVLYLVVIDLHCRLGRIRPARCVKPALPPPSSPRFRPRGVSKGLDYSNALRCARTPVPCVKTTCRVRPSASCEMDLQFSIYSIYRLE